MYALAYACRHIGKALAVIRPDTEGTITVIVEAEGLERKVISLEAVKQEER